MTTRFRDPLDLSEELAHVAALLRARTGCLEVLVGRNLDDPELWTLTSRWADVGSYRRALGSHEVKMFGTPTFLKAIDEPSAYEVLGESAVLNESRPRSSGGPSVG